MLQLHVLGSTGSASATELLAQAEMLEENLTWMSDERYRSASKKAMLHEMRTSRERRREDASE